MHVSKRLEIMGIPLRILFLSFVGIIGSYIIFRVLWVELSIELEEVSSFPFRFQILRDLIPHSDQKRDTASFLLEVLHCFV